MKHRRLLALAVVVALSAGLALAAGRLGGLTGVDALRWTTLDWRQRTTATSFRPGAGPREAEVLLVLFDELAVTDPETGWPWEQPFPRSEIAAVVDALAGAGARTIGLDVYLERLHPRLNALDGGDDALRAAMERAGNVVLVAPVAPTDSGPVLRPPHPWFAEVAAGVGAADLPTPFETVRDGTLAVRSGDALEPSFALALWAHARGVDADSLLAEAHARGRIDLPGLPASVGRVPEAWRGGGASRASTVIPFTLRLFGPPSGTNEADPPGTFPAVSSSMAPLAASFDPELFRDRIVLVGSGFHDSERFRTAFYGVEAPPEAPGGPSRAYGWMYGVEVHANALQDMLDGAWVRPVPPWGEILLLLLAALLSGGAVFLGGAGWGGLAAGGTLLALGVAAFWTWAGEAFLPGGGSLALGRPFLWFPLVTPALAALLSWTGSVAWVAVVEGRERRFIQRAFGRYVSPEVVAEISRNPEALRLGGQKRSLTLLFSDLEGFTGLSERLPPQELLGRLNEYLSEMTRIVLDEGGTLDKYVGDAIMAFWNAPRDVPDHADRALRAALRMQRTLDGLDVSPGAGGEAASPLSARIGIHTGTVVVGNMGGQERFDYSAVGDAVNLASRLEPANKGYGTRVMVSEATLARARPDGFRVRELDLLAVKGREEPVRVYELLGEAEEDLPPHREEALRRYAEALAAYRRRAWEAAADGFRAALEVDPGDGPSRIYLERALEHAEKPPPPDWDFVVRRTEK